MNKEQRYERAKKDIENKVGFVIHLGVYLLVNIFILIPQNGFDVLDGSLLPTFGWGIGLVAHFLKVFILNDNYIEKVVDRKMNDN